jgi:1,4-dihydroxy-6-naphthoate synthase
MRLKLAISPCPNDIYIFSGILKNQITDPELHFEPTFIDVQAANEAAKNNAFDVIKVSYAAYPQLKEHYELLPCGGALGRGVGPLLLKNGTAPFDFTQPILVPGAQTTANFLLDFWAQQPLEKQYLAFDALYEQLKQTPNAQGVVIHEKRFTYAADNLTLIQDLGEHWENKTHHPIPLGAILVRRELALSEQLTKLIQQSLAWAEAHRAEALELCRHYASDLTDGVIEAHIQLYVNAYSHDLGPDGQAAVNYFLEQIKP